MKRNLKQDFRMATAPFRVVPDFVVPGEAKCGTTSFFENLRQHPDVYGPLRKEPRTFSLYGASDLLCRMHYPTKVLRCWRQVALGRRLLAGEASTDYLSRRDVPKSIKLLVPHARFIVLLREPVARAYSDYRMMFKRGVIDIPFDSLMRRSMAWVRNVDLAPLLQTATQERRAVVRYLMRGMYVENIRTWMDVFSPERFLFIRSEDYFTGPQHELDRAFDFLGLEPFRVQDLKVRQQGDYQDSPSPELVAEMSEFYRPYNEQLYRLLGRDLGWG